MKYRAIVFDLDGTIADTERLWKEVTNGFLSSRGITLTEQEKDALHLQLHGAGLKPACTLIKQLFAIDDPLHEIINEKVRRALELYEQEVQFIDGFTNFHAKLSPNGLKSGIATNADDHTLGRLKRALKLEDFFGEHIYNISHVNNIPKPHPALYEHAADRLGICPTQCVAIEDSAVGIEAAQRAGMFCIGITTSRNPEQTAAANLVIDHYDHIDLLRLLKKL